MQQQLKVNEIFYSLQGEGPFSGCAAVFVRMATCTMGCQWCDTKYAQKVNFLMTEKQILKEIKKYPAKLVIITGGEPCEQNIIPLAKLLKEKKYQIHLETNGSVDIDRKYFDFIAVSPKKYVAKQMLKKADIIKLVIDGKTSLKEILKYRKYNLYLQPNSAKKENTEKCVQIVKKYPKMRLSVQMHKLIKIK